MMWNHRVSDELSLYDYLTQLKFVTKLLNYSYDITHTLLQAAFKDGISQIKSKCKD